MTATTALICLTLATATLIDDAPNTTARVGNIKLRDVQGKPRTFDDLAGKGPVVAFFFAVECPLARAYTDRIVEIERGYAPRGVRFLAINSNPLDADDELHQFLAAHAVGFPVARDDGSGAASMGVFTTPAVVLLDDHRVIRYRGRIDDEVTLRYRRTQPTRADLVEAIEELLHNRSISVPETPTVGCPIDERLRVPSRPATQTEVGYHGAVASILARHCVTCHQPGQVAPFRLDSYRQAKRWSRAIRDAVDDGRMPPWHADPRYGRFANDPRLSDAERATLFAWIDAGSPEGVGEALPQIKERHEAVPGWSIVEPDLVLSMPAPFRIPAEGEVPYQEFELDPGFTENRWIRAAEILPGCRGAVHHATVFLRPPETRERTAEGELKSGYLVLYTPGCKPFSLPCGTAKLVPAGWRLVLVVHYSTQGKAVTDQTRVGLVFAEASSVVREVATRLISAEDLRIPPHTPSHRVEKEVRLERDVMLFAMLPHMHLRGRSFEFDAIYPDGRIETLLRVPRYDFHWQHRYELAEPLRLPSGTRLRCVAEYDNSAKNPANPDPGAFVHTGKRSVDEMFNGYYDVAFVDLDLARRATWGERFAEFALDAAGGIPVGRMAVVIGACAAALVTDRLRRACFGTLCSRRPDVNQAA